MLSFFLKPLLTKVEHQLQCNVQSIAKDSAIVTVGHISNTLKGVITGYLVSRLFPQEMYGAYRFALSIIGAVSFLSLVGFPSILSRHIIQEKERAHIRSAILLYSLWCIAISIIIILGMIILNIHQGKTNMLPLLIVTGVLFGSSNIGANSFGALVHGESRFDLGVKTTAIINCLQVIGVLLMLYTYQSPIILILCTMGIPSCVYCIKTIQWMRKYPSQKTYAPYIKKTIQLSMINIPTTISWYIDGLLVSYYFGLKELALLSVIYLIPDQVKVWSKEMLPIAYVRNAAGEDSNEKRERVEKVVIIGMAIMIVAVSIYWTISPLMIPLLFPKYTSHSILLLSNIAALTIIPIPATLFTQYLEARGKISELQWSTWSTSGIYIIVMYILIPRFGVMGAIISRIIFRMIHGIIGWYVFKKCAIKK